MNRKGTGTIAEAIAQLQRELEEYRRMQPRRAKLPASIWKPRRNWHANMVSMRSRIHCG